MRLVSKCYRSYCYENINSARKLCVYVYVRKTEREKMRGRGKEGINWFSSQKVLSGSFFKLSMVPCAIQ